MVIYMIYDGQNYMFGSDRSLTNEEMAHCLALAETKGLPLNGYGYAVDGDNISLFKIEEKHPEPKSEYEEGYDDSTYDSLEDEEV